MQKRRNVTGYLRDDIFETPVGVQRQMASPRRISPDTVVIEASNSKGGTENQKRSQTINNSQATITQSFASIDASYPPILPGSAPTVSESAMKMM